MDHTNGHHVDVYGLKDGPYNPNVAGFDFYHQVMSKDQECGGKSCLDDDMFYP